MDRHEIALTAAGVIGAGTAAIHGVLTQLYLVRPLTALAQAGTPGAPGMPAPIIRLIGPLLQFSTFVWGLGGLALIAVAAGGLPAEARRPVVLGVALAYLFGVIGNFWATEGKHPGWMLLALALALMAYAMGPF